jgi:carboxyl-terminal processing protease
LRYTTKSGRVVYGGGGIMPDFFVPIDTTGNSDYYSSIYRKGLIYSFAYAYADEHRKDLSGLKAYEFDSYLDQKKVLEEFLNYAAGKGIPRDNAGLKTSSLIIQTQLKAYIARNIIGEEGFYPIIKKIDNMLLRAIEISKKDLLVENINGTNTIKDPAQAN